MWKTAFKKFEGCLPQILLSTFLNTLTHLFIMYAKFPEKLTFHSPLYLHLHVHVRRWEMLVFSENFTHILNRWSLKVINQSVPVNYYLIRIIQKDPLMKSQDSFFYYSTQWLEQRPHRAVRRNICKVLELIS